MASIDKIIQRKYETYDKETFINECNALVTDIACRFVLYLDNIGVDPLLNLNEGFEVFRKYYEETTDISGNEISK